MFGWNDEEKKWAAMHHPFTAPMDEDLPHFAKNEELGKVRAKAYDMVLNGYEVGGGSIRIHRQDVQSRVFEILGMSIEEAKSRFGFLLDALQSGAPPHGGIALGLDRWCDDPRGHDEHPRRDRVPEEPAGPRPDDRRPGRGRRAAVEGVGCQVEVSAICAQAAGRVAFD